MPQFSDPLIGAAETARPAGRRPARVGTVHLLEVGRQGGPTDLISVGTLADSVAYLRRRTGRPDVAALARLAWAGGRVQIGALRVRGWTRRTTALACPHCGQPVYPRAVSCRDELEEAGLSRALPPGRRVSALGLVFPAAECPTCLENVTFPNPFPEVRP